MKGSQAILLFLLLLVIGGVGAYLYFHKNHNPYLPAAMALPESSVFAMQGQKIEEDFAALSQNDFYRFFSQNPAVASFNREYHWLDSLVSSDAGIKKSLSQNPLIASLHVTSANDFQLLFLHQTAGAFDKEDVESFIEKTLSNARTLEHIYENVKIYDVNGPNKEKLFSYSFMDGIIAISRSPVLVEDAVHAYHINKSKSNDMVERMVALNQSEKIYVNYQRLPELVNTYTAPDYHDAVSRLSGLADFGVYDWKLDNYKMTLSGSLSATAKNNKLWSLLLDQKAQPVNIPQVLPSETAIFMEWGVDNFQTYYTHYKDYLKITNSLDAYNQKRTALESATALNLEDDLGKLVSKGWGYAMLEPANENVEPEKILVIKPGDTTDAISKLRTINERISSRSGSSNAPVNYRQYTIDKMQFSGAFGLLFGDLFSSFDSPYYAQVGDFIVFANTTETIQKCIDAFRDNQNLARLPSYKAYAASLTSESNFCMYISPSRSILSANSYLRDDFKEKYKQNIETYRGVNGLSFQVSSNGKDFYSQITMAQSSVLQSNAEQVWSLQLDADPATKPFIVLNADNHQKEIMVQDKNNNLYLIGNAGSIIWKKQLPEHIAGDVYQIDLYKNDQLEYLFATSSMIYLLDHDGQNAGNYPLHLGTPTTTGVALFDYHKNKEYRYFIGDNRNRVYGYYGNGKPLITWAPMNIDAELSTPLKFFTNKNSVYLFGVTNKGTFYVWTEDGKTAIKPLSLNARFKNPFKVNFGAAVKDYTFFSVDTNGVMHTVTLDGKEQKRRFSRFTHSPFFDYFDTDGNGRNEYILAGDDLIASYENDSVENWKLITSEKIQYPPQKIDFNGKTFIGYVSANAGKVYLFTRAGTPFPNFPVAGNTPFAVDDLNGNQDLEMVVGGANRMLYLYRLSQ